MAVAAKKIGPVALAAINKVEVAKGQVEGLGNADSSKEATKRTVGKPFQPGQSGNPGGRAPIPDDVKQMLKAACPQAVKLLVKTINDETSKPDLRIKCVEIIMDRTYGKATQPIEGEFNSNTLPPAVSALTLEELRALILEGKKE